MTYAVLAAGLVTAVSIDLRSRRIPNSLTASMALAGIALAAAGQGHLTVTMSIAGLVLGLLLMLPGHTLGATGAGDVKLMAAVGALIGPGDVVMAFLLTCIAGGVLAVIVAIRRRRFAETVSATTRLVTNPGNASEQVQSAPAASRFAYGPAIAAGSLTAVLLA